MLGQILCLERLASVSHQTEDALIWSHTEPRHPNLKNQSQSPISSHSHTLGNKFAAGLQSRQMYRVLSILRNGVCFYIQGFACWSDEDMIGRISRTSRRVGTSKLVAFRTLSRTLMSYKRQFRRYFASCRKL